MVLLALLILGLMTETVFAETIPITIRPSYNALEVITFSGFIPGFEQNQTIVYFESNDQFVFRSDLNLGEKISNSGWFFFPTTCGNE